VIWIVTLRDGKFKEFESALTRKFTKRHKEIHGKDLKELSSRWFVDVLDMEKEDADLLSSDIAMLVTRGEISYRFIKSNYDEDVAWMKEKSESINGVNDFLVKLQMSAAFMPKGVTISKGFESIQLKTFNETISPADCTRSYLKQQRNLLMSPATTNPVPTAAMSPGMMSSIIDSPLHLPSSIIGSPPHLPSFPNHNHNGYHIISYGPLSTTAISQDDSDDIKLQGPNSTTTTNNSATRPRFRAGSNPVLPANLPRTARMLPNQHQQLHQNRQPPMRRQILWRFIPPTQHA